MRYKICTIILLIMLIATACNKEEYMDCLNCVQKKEERSFGEWELVNRELASRDGQEIFSLDGHEVTHDFGVNLSAELIKLINVEFGYDFSISSLKCAGTSAVIDKGQTIEFYCRPVYDIYELDLAVYSDKKMKKEKDRQTIEVEQLSAAQYGWVIYDEEGTILEDTRDNPVDVGGAEEAQTEDEAVQEEEFEEETEPLTEPLTEPAEIETVENVNRESESNNTLEEADDINVNQDIQGSLYFEPETDRDYYRFRVSEKGSIAVVFRHGKIDSDSVFWNIVLLSGSDENVILETGVKGNVSEFCSDKVRIAPGEYELKIEPRDYSDADYTFDLVFTAEDDGYETEENDSFEKANEIYVNQEYIGNIHDREDCDYYYFDLPVKGKLWIDFYHEKFDDAGTFWQGRVSNDIDDRIPLTFYVTGGVGAYTSDAIRLPAGKHYLKIEDDYYSNMDYRFLIHYAEEYDNAETEPNNDFPEATDINISTDYTGNIQSPDDTDYYCFYNDIMQNINVTFTHQLTDRGDTFWRIRIINDQMDEDLNSYYIRGNDESSMCLLFENVQAGECFLIVEHDYYNNTDYMIRVN